MKMTIFIPKQYAYLSFLTGVFFDIGDSLNALITAEVDEVSNSKMLGVYYNDPLGPQGQGWKFTISTMNEAKGTFTGSIQWQNEPSVAIKKGYFQFQDSAKQTHLSFNESGEWNFIAPYQADERHFDSWHASRNYDENSPPKEYEFYHDLSGEGGHWTDVITTGADDRHNI